MDYSYDNLGYGVRLFAPDGQDVFLQDEAAYQFLDELHGALDTWVQTEAFPTPDDLEQWYLSQYFETPQQPTSQFALRLVNPPLNVLRCIDKNLPAVIPSSLTVEENCVGSFVLMVPSWEFFVDTIARYYPHILRELLPCITFDSVQQIYVVSDTATDWILDTLPIRIGSPSIRDSLLDVYYIPVTIPNWADFIEAANNTLITFDLREFVRRIRFKV